MEGKSSFFILLFIVAFLSLTLAVLAGYVFFVGGSPKAATETVKQEDAKKPAESDLVTVQLFDGKKYLNLKSTDDKKLSVIQIGISIKYIKPKSDKKAHEEKGDPVLGPYMDELKESVIAYFGNMTAEEAKNQGEAMEKAKKDLVKRFNEIVPADEKEKQSVVYTVVFYDWFTQ